MLDIIMFPRKNIADNELKYILNQDLDDEFVDYIISDDTSDDGDNGDCLLTIYSYHFTSM